MTLSENEIQTAREIGLKLNDILYEIGDPSDIPISLVATVIGILGRFELKKSEFDCASGRGEIILGSEGPQNPTIQVRLTRLGNWEATEDDPILQDYTFSFDKGWRNNMDEQKE